MQVGVSYLGDKRLQGSGIGNCSVDWEADKVKRSRDAIELCFMLLLRKRSAATCILLETPKQLLERVREASVPVGRLVPAQLLELALQPILHLALELRPLRARARGT